MHKTLQVAKEAASKGMAVTIKTKIKVKPHGDRSATKRSARGSRS